MKSDFSDKSTIVKYCITAGIAALLALFYAVGTAFPYDYVQGATWNYPDLVTEAPLAVTVAGATGDSVVQQVESRYIPVFRMDRDILQKKKEMLEKDFQRQLKLASKDNAFPDVSRSPQLYLQFAERLLSKIYEQGIIPEHEKLKGRSEVQILRGEQLKSSPVAKIYNIESARQAIADSLPGSKLRESEFLLSLLEDKIEVNLSYDEDFSEKSRNSTFQNFIQHRDTLAKGTVIAERGALIDDEVFYRIETYRNYIEGSRSSTTILSRFFLCFLLNLIFLTLMDVQISAFQPELMHTDGFLVLLAIVVFALQGAHLYGLRLESTLLLSPLLLSTVLLRKSTIPFVNAGIFVLMVLMASHAVILPYLFTVAMLSGGLLYLFSERYFHSVKYGLYLQGISATLVLVIVYALMGLMHNAILQWLHLTLTFLVQSVMMLLATKYTTYVKQ